MPRTRTVYEELHSNESANEAVVEIQQVIKSKKLSISEAIVILDIVKHNWMHELIATDKEDSVLGW